MTPPPRRPTPFPYTTLFRSPALHSRSAGTEARQPHADAEAVAAERCQCAARREVQDRHCAAGHRVAEDRKSTRLNSSHRCISYAVFRLKKKQYISAPHYELD